MVVFTQHDSIFQDMLLLWHWWGHCDSNTWNAHLPLYIVRLILMVPLPGCWASHDWRPGTLDLWQTFIDLSLVQTLYMCELTPDSGLKELFDMTSQAIKTNRNKANFFPLTSITSALTHGSPRKCLSYKICSSNVLMGRSLCDWESPRNFLHCWQWLVDLSNLGVITSYMWDWS